MPPKVGEGVCSPWTFQGLTLCIMSIVFCRIQGAILTNNAEVELGGNATLRCTLTNHQFKTIQVSWQKAINQNFVNMAVYYNETFIADSYKGRINFTIIEVNDTAITFWNVSTQENGCYRCIFNTFPGGAFEGDSCLSVYDNLNTFLHYTVSDGHLNATCLATGFPRPNISWIAPGAEKNEHEIANPNGTVSVTSKILVNTSSSHFGQELICKVTHRGKETDIKVPVKKRGYWYLVPVVITVSVLISVIVVIIVVCCWKRHMKKRRRF
ncbi:OX-2 membrane glycoprotein-like [Rhineura floridana]|uniref:OX-2 membrane glycoprotein-like n=1 Tax=Rhineura floridana TaxID=261503 RepID=UPI002AC8634C|nr:OX-2 membrane glycoprotein-like [Rhineura floridana]